MANVGASPTPNATSVAALRSMMEVEPVLAKKWASETTESSVNITPDRVQLDENGNITFLNLGGIRLKKLPDVWSTLIYLTTLNLGGTDLPLDQMKVVLHSLVNVEDLCLGGIGLGVAGAELVGDVIENSATIKHLDMR